ncbi:hypothetical protein EsH8_VIII_000101 [Colletotrichum jinshuiense]
MASTEEQPIEAVKIYDENWYVHNSREDPEVLPDSHQDEGSNIPDDAERSQDKTARDIASQRRGGPHAPLITTKPPPPKLMNRGAWNYIQYIPPWTDPMWDGDYTVALGKHDHLVRSKNVFEHIRPAQLPQDRSQNPTAMAVRFGIYPGRKDGRSRLTPTRSTFRKFKVDGVVRDDVTGKYIEQEAEALAKSYGLDGIDELLDKYSQMNRKDPGSVSVRDMYVLQAMQEMQDDEDWQSLHFAGMTTHETDEYLWERLQPALQLASRFLYFLEQHDPFWDRLMDVFNRVRINGPRDYRTRKERRKFPAYSFGMQEPDNHRSSKKLAADLNRVAIDPVEETAKIMRSRITLQIGSAYSDWMNDKGLPVSGYTMLESDSIIVSLSADAVWPLLVQGYSKDEHMQACFTVANTLVHEFAHAVNYAQVLWLHKPGPKAMGVLASEPLLQEEVIRVGEALFGTNQDMPEIMEPFFETDQRCELGYCLENHLFGGNNWQIINQAQVHSKNLEFLPAGSMLRRWPDGYVKEHSPSLEHLKRKPSDLVLKTPPMMADTSRIPIKISQIARFYSESFWDVETARFGNAALRLGSDAPTRIRMPMDEIIMEAAGNLFPKTREMLMNAWPFDDEMQSLGYVVEGFLNRVYQEYTKLYSMRFRWARDHRSFPSRLDIIQKNLLQFMIVSEEARLSHFAARFSLTDTPAAYERWQKTMLGAYRDLVAKFRGQARNIEFQLPVGSEVLQDDATFWSRIHRVASNTQPRVGALLRTTHELFLLEVGCLQELYANIYKLTPKERELFKDEDVVDTLGNRVKELHRMASSSYNLLEGVKDYAPIAAIHGEFSLKFNVLTQMLKEFYTWGHDIATINPSNFDKLLPLIPNIKNARRPASLRLVKLVQREIDLAPVGALESVHNTLMFVEDKVAAAGLVNVDSRRDMQAAVEELETKLMEAYKLDAKPQHIPKDNAPDDDPLKKIIIAGKRRRYSGSGGGRVAKRPKYTTPPRLIHPQLRHSVPLISYTPAHALKLFNYAAPQYGSVSRPGSSKPKPSASSSLPKNQIPNVFAGMPSVTFPKGQPGQPSPFSAAPVAALPVATSMFPHVQIGPEPVGLFPHPYAFSATFTEDLLHEARVRDVITKQSSRPLTVPPLAFTKRQGFNASYREPIPLVPDSPESHMSGFKNNVKDRHDHSPTSDGLSPPLSSSGASVVQPPTPQPQVVIPQQETGGGVAPVAWMGPQSHVARPGHSASGSTKNAGTVSGWTPINRKVVGGPMDWSPTRVSRERHSPTSTALEEGDQMDID